LEPPSNACLNLRGAITIDQARTFKQKAKRFMRWRRRRKSV
jgi:hypothetical protein